MGRKCDFWRPPGRVYILRHGCGHCRCADCCKGDAINAAPGAPKHPSRNQCTSHWPHADKRETEEYGCRARSVQTTAAIWNYKKVHWRISIDTCASDSVGCPESLHAAQKRIYMGIAERYCVNWKTIERNIRTLSTAAWRENPEYLELLAQYPLIKRPTSVQFMEIMLQNIRGASM